jgi:molybdopterin/thiamine biosynthesis adenylyltransferase
MNYQIIAKHLESCGYEAAHEKWSDSVDCLRIKISISGTPFTLLHFCLDELRELPQFYLEQLDRDEPLAHVMPAGANGLSFICVTTSDAVSVNFEVPKLAFEASLDRHVDLLSRAITDPEWNVLELTREFQANWGFLCQQSKAEFICASPSSTISTLKVVSPKPGKKYGIESSFIGFPSNISTSDLPSVVRRQLETPKTRSSLNGVVIPLGEIGPPPKSSKDVKPWFQSVISNLSPETRSWLGDAMSGVKSRVFWFVLNGDTPSGTAWFGVRLSSGSKKFLPLGPDAITLWDIEPINVQVFDKNILLPRSGAEPVLSDKKVLIVGCGSVGAEIAVKLGAAGIGAINLSDPDSLSWQNTYRHVLPTYFTGCNKASALSLYLENQYPWIDCKWSRKRLLDYRDADQLKRFDLIIVAIGSPTHERLFSNFFNQEKGLPAVVNTWVEGFGVGGHATLSVPNQAGCLNCAYMDNNTFKRGLVSNLNFIEKNQNLTRNIAGCGDLFLPYSGIAASKTALIASELAIKHLSGGLNQSSAISWKGNDDQAEQAEVELTHRYYNFKSQLEILPLYHEACDVCGSRFPSQIYT